MFQGTDVFLNRTIECQYNGKARVGKVVKATPTFITIEFFKGCLQKPQYRTLTLDKITNLAIVK